jgi:hypothetical protein
MGYSIHIQFMSMHSTRPSSSCRTVTENDRVVPIELVAELVRQGSFVCGYLLACATDMRALSKMKPDIGTNPSFNYSIFNTNEVEVHIVWIYLVYGELQILCL